MMTMMGNRVFRGFHTDNARMCSSSWAQAMQEESESGGAADTFEPSKDDQFAAQMSQMSQVAQMSQMKFAATSNLAVIA